MRRILLWIAGVVAALAIVVVLAFRLSPWPSVAIIEYTFANNDVASEAALAKHVPPGIVTVADVAYGTGPDERADVFYRDGAGAQATVVWVHGGAWIAGSKEGVSNYLRILAGEGFTTVALEYSTGYGSVYPKPVEQVNAALAYLLAHAAELHVDPARIVIAGDSAGAQIASQVALLTTDAGYAGQLGIAAAVPAATIKGAVLVSGAFDLEGLDFAGSYGQFLKTVLWAYSGVRNMLSDERFRLGSIVQHATAAFPPSFISSGNGDPLEPQARRMADRLTALGVKTSTLFFPAALSPPLPHEYQFDLDRPEGVEAEAAIVAFLRTTVP
jgi:acetyl esterase/lipase